MKHILNRICSIALLASVLLLYTSCPAAASAQEADAGMKAGLISTAESISQAILELDQDEIDSYKAAGDEFTVSAMEAWESARDELGEFKSLSKSSVVEELSDGYSVRIPAEFSNYSAELVYLYDETGVPRSLSIDIQYPMSVLLQRAGMNTIMGMGIVFLMLIFLTLVISLFRFIGKMEEKNQTEGKVLPEPAEPMSVPQPVVAVQDDRELIAVIAAAIAAYEGTSTDSFVVRSVRRAGRRRNSW